MSARLIYVLGPSGAGKDSVLDWLKTHIADHPEFNAQVYWTRRSITRAAVVGGEAHESLSVENFDLLQLAGAFALSWQANGLSYAIRHDELNPLRGGGWVFVNGSRGYLKTASELFPDLLVLHITASMQSLRQRLLARGRESHERIDARLARTADLGPLHHPRLIEVNNDQTLEETGQAVLAQLKQLPGWP
jgi:ribose 1,5-bisphosphokinase